MGDDYFQMPEEVAKGGVHEAIRSGRRDVSISNLLWQIADASDSLGKSDRIHLFVMLCGGGTKIETDAIEDVKFSTDNGNLIAVVRVPSAAVGHWSSGELRTTVKFAVGAHDG